MSFDFIINCNAISMGKVNEKTRMLGLENSNFLVPDGHDTEGQYTTAYDLVIILILS